MAHAYGRCPVGTEVVTQRSVTPTGDLPEGDKTSKAKMFYVYFLVSKKNNDLYIGSTEDVANRLNRHNCGKVKSTKAYRPWELLGYEECSSRSEAVIKEKFFKTGQQKERLKQKYGLVAKW